MPAKENVRRLEYLSLAELKGAKRNPKKHADAEVQTSIGRFGYVEPMVLDERTGSLVAGHGRRDALMAMRSRGEAPPSGVKEKGVEWLVPVLRGWASRSDTEAEAYLVASNQLTTLGGWDSGPLSELLKDLAAADALDGTGFTDADLGALLDVAEPAGGNSDPDDAPETPAESYVQKGDAYQLGDHRIVCGDCTDTAVVDAVMQGLEADACWTDPPWNVALDTEAMKGRPSKPGREIANDNLGEAYPQFLAAFAGQAARIMKPGALIYVAMSTSEWATVDAAMKAMGFHWSTTLVWRKDSLVVGRKDYHSQFEPIWYGWKAGARLCPVEDRSQSDVWDIPRPKRSDEHPTMKPVELIERALLNSTKRGAIVFEPFSGSGSTLMACEKTGRKCRAIELEPKYVQVAIDRWEKFTGKKAVKLG